MRENVRRRTSKREKSPVKAAWIGENVREAKTLSITHMSETTRFCARVRKRQTKPGKTETTRDY